MTIETTKTTPPTAGPDPLAEFRRLRLVLWQRTLVIEAMGIIICLLKGPQYLVPLLGGMMLGNFNLWSLMLNAERPNSKVQFAFSLTRVVVLAYLIVLIGNFKSPEVIIVICGFLSYKLGLWMEYVVQGAKAIPIFLKQGRAARQPEKYLNHTLK